MTHVLTFGEPLLVWIPQETGSFSEVTHFQKAAAGAELNVSIGLSRLGHTVTYLSAVGDDFAGRFLLGKMQKEHIDTTAVKIDPDHLTGTYFKTKTEQGDPEVFYMRKTSAASHLSPDSLANISASDNDIIHLTGITAALSESCYETSLRIQDMAWSAANRPFLTFDPNLRLSLWKSEDQMISRINALAFRSDLVMPGIAEGRLLTGKSKPEAIADYYFEHGTQKAVIIKNGAQGAYYQSIDGERGDVPGYFVPQIVDTVGAGDAFAAGVLSALLESLDMQEAVRRGNAMGALMIAAPGDNDALPDRHILQQFTHTHFTTEESK